MRAPRPTSSPEIDLARLFAELPAGVLHATDEKIDYANPAVARLLGWEPEELIGRDLFETAPAASRALVEQRYRARLRGDPSVPERYELEILRRDGQPVRLEVEPRATGERSVLLVVRDLRDRLRDSALLAALAEAALTVQRSRTPEQVLDAAAAALAGQGIHFMIARCRGEALVCEQVGLAGAEGRALEQLLGHALVGMQMPRERLQVFPRLAHERRAIFLEAALPFFAEKILRHSPQLDRADVEQRLSRAGVSRCVMSPLVVEGEVWGLLGAASDRFAPADATALGLFASQIALALEHCEAIARVERRNRELAAVQQVAAAGSEASLERLLPQLVEIAAASLGCDDAAIYLVDEKQVRLELAEASARARPLLERYASFPLDSEAVRRAFVQLKPVTFSLEDLPEATRQALSARGYRELAVVPLHIKGHLAGSLALGRLEKRPFGADELRSAELLAGQLAIQVENARLYARASRQLHLVSTLFDLSKLGTDALDVRSLVDRVISQAMSALGVDNAGIHILEGGKLVLAGQKGSDPEHERLFREIPCDTTSLSGRAVIERRVLAMEEPTWRALPTIAARSGPARAVAVAPLIAKDRVQGTLLVARHDARRFEGEELRLLESFAAQAGAALEQARSLAEERRRIEELNLFLEVGRVVTASLDLDQILEASAVSLARITEATDGFVLLLDAHRRLLKGVASSNPGYREHFRTVRIGLDDRSVVSQTVLTRLPVRVPDAAEANLLRSDLVERYRQKSLVVLPLTVRDEAIGAVMLSDARGPRQWSDAQIERATVLARQVAVAVANARLYEDLKRSYQELARTQEELVKRERLAALGELAAVVAHEVRNPLGVIFNSLRSLKRVLKPEGDAEMLLGIVGEEADRLNRIVGDLLDFARPSEPALQPEPLGAVLSSVKEAATQAAAASAVSILVLARDPVPRAAVDARMLRQALLNLVLNAIQAMPRGGTVTLSAGEEVRGERSLARIEVADTGPGIPPELSERVFQPFFTTKAAGTGLGLAVVKRIVEAHHGEVALDSAPGHGARFTLRLPLR